MLKQYEFDRFGIYYVCIPNRENIILTSDGVLININTLKNTSMYEYQELKNNQSKFDYIKTKESEVLVKKAIQPQIKKNTTIDSMNEVEESNVQEEKPVYKNKEKIKPKTKKNTLKKFIKGLNVNDTFSMCAKIIMLFLCIGTGILSVFYTGTYMSNIVENKFIGYLISLTMYLYGLIGFNYADIFRDKKKYVFSTIFLLTSLCTILFSMTTSLFVNGERYYAKYVEVLQEKELDIASKGELIKNIEQQIEFKNNAINDLIAQNETLSKTYSIMWDGNLKTNVIVEGKITEKAQDGININNQKIELYNNDITELQNKKYQLLEQGYTIESKLNQIETFTELISKYFHVNGSYIELFLLLFCSVFTDIIGPLALCIARDK